nr:hypothetical protein [Tanacetum cinerariifolium]
MRFREEVTTTIQNAIVAALGGLARDTLRRGGEDPVDTCHDDSILELEEDIVQEEGTEEILEFMFNFQELRMDFKYKGRKVALRGTKKTTLLWMEGLKVPKPSVQLSLMVLYVYPSTTLHMMSAATTE